MSVPPTLALSRIKFTMLTNGYMLNYPLVWFSPYEVVLSRNLSCAAGLINSEASTRTVFNITDASV